MLKRIFYNDVNICRLAIHKKYLLFGFVIINILTGLGCGIISMVLPLFAISIGASTSDVGIIKGISGIGALIMVLPSGILVDNFGAKRLYVFGSIFSAITTFMLAFSISSEIIIIAMALQGFSNSLRFTSLNAAFFNKLNEIGIEKSGWYRGAMSIGMSFIGPLVGGYLLSIVSYSNVFNITAILTLVPMIPLLLFIFMENDDEKSTKIKFNMLEQLKEFKELLKDNILRQTVIIEGVSTACFCSFATFIVVYIVNILDIEVQYASWFLITEGTSYVIIVFLGGGLLYRYSRKNLYLTSIITMMLGLLSMAVYKNAWIIMFGTILLGQEQDY